LKVVFEVSLYRKDVPDDYRNIDLLLPATPYEMLDALERLGLRENEQMGVEITDYTEFPYLMPFLEDTDNLHELNELAEKLSTMNYNEHTVFAGLLQMDVNSRRESIPVTRLIDLAHSTDSCHHVSEALNDVQLGRFYAENGFVPEVEGISDAVFEMLDFEMLGYKMRTNEKGVFVERGKYGVCGYVVLDGEIMEAHKNMDFSPKTPDYTVLVEISKAGRESSGKTALLKMPCTPEQFGTVAAKVEAGSWSELDYRYIDCSVPMLSEAITNSRDLSEVALLARQLHDMKPKELATYKALIEATGCADLYSALTLTHSLDHYIHSPEYKTPVELARGELDLILNSDAMEMLLPHVDLQAYGKTLLENDYAVMTEYGMIERRDGQPIRKFGQQQEQGGMQMGGM